MEMKAKCYNDPFFLTIPSHTLIQGRKTFLWRDVLNQSLPVGGGHLASYSHSGTPKLKTVDWLTTEDCCELSHPPGSCSPKLTTTLGYLCIYNFIMPTQCSSGLDSLELLKLVYTNASCDHFVNTAGTSDSVKGQYATCGKRNKQLSFVVWLVLTYQ